MSEPNAPGDERGEMTIEWVFDAPPALVFECLTTPEHLTHFWGPPGVTTPLANITIDPRVGGEFTTIMVNDENGEEYPNRGEYTEFDPPNRLAWREFGVAEGMESSIDFIDLGDGRTRTVTTQVRVPLMFLTPEARAGMEASFGRFNEYLHGLT